MKRVLAPIILLLVAVGCFYFYGSTQQFNGYPRKEASLNSTRLTLIIADTQQRKITGLSGSKPLKDNEGMLFQFPVAGRYGFWMKEMNYSLDFIYLRNSVVVEIKKSISPKTYPNIIVPTNEINAVIEVVAGMVNKNNIRIGDKLVYN